MFLIGGVRESFPQFFLFFPYDGRLFLENWNKLTQKYFDEILLTSSGYIFFGSEILGRKKKVFFSATLKLIKNNNLWPEDLAQSDTLPNHKLHLKAFSPFSR